jgi:hypothetical protein
MYYIMYYTIDRVIKYLTEGRQMSCAAAGTI